MGTVRIATPDDSAAIAAIYAPYVLHTPISFEEVPPSPDAMRARIEKVLAAYPFLVFEDDEGVQAYAYASPHAERAAYRWSCDVGIYAAPTAHGRGIGRRLYTVLLDLLRLQGFHSAHGGITLPNDKSVGLHEALGFKLAGTFREVGFKLGAWHDVGRWQCLLSPGQPAGEPLAFPQLTADDLRQAGVAG